VDVAFSRHHQRHRRVLKNAGDLPLHPTIFSIYVKYLPDSARCGYKRPRCPPTSSGVFSLANAPRQKVTELPTARDPESAEQSNDEDRRYRAPALEKGLDVLELLAARGEPLTMMQISTELARSVSELFRMVQVLEFRGYVQMTESGNGYVLTDRLFALGMTRAPAKDLVQAAIPYMRGFAQKTNQSCHLVVASGDQMVVVNRVEAAGDVGFSVRVGFRRPLVGSSSGLVLFAFQPESIRNEWKLRLSPAVGQRAWDDFETLARKARRDGFVRRPSDLTKGITDLSAPIMHLGMVVGALTCPHVETRKSFNASAALTYVRSTAQEVTQALAGGLE
jgi:DNA-binding IclR family transcriptional regulator